MKEIINEIFDKDVKVDKKELEIIKRHCQVVEAIALEVAENYEKKTGKKLDKELISRGALVHDIGVTKVVDGRNITHGEIGYHWLINNNYPKSWANFCLTHIGVGLNAEEIKNTKLNQSLDHMPQSLEEKIVAYADNFTSKGSRKLYWNEVSVMDLKIKSYGENQFRRWQEWKEEFGIPEGKRAKIMIEEFNEKLL